MNKTPLREQIIDRLTALNDQLCFFLLLENELSRRLLDFGPRVLDALTPDVFAQNPYAPKINVRLGELPAFQNANRSFTFGAYFSTSYEVASDFFSEATALLVEMNGVKAEKPKREGPEQTYVRTLKTAGLAVPASEIIDTLSYCRYRRNAFIHLHSDVSEPYQRLADDKGAALNTYWDTTAAALDFSEATVGPSKESEAIALIKLLRIGIHDLDGHLASILNREAVLSSLAKERFGKQATRMNSDVAAQRRRTLASVYEQEYGGSASEIELDPLVRKVGVR